VGNAILDTTALEVRAAPGEVVALVRMQLGRPATRPTWRSVIRWRLLPSLPRSVGLGSVCEPPGGWAHWRHPYRRG
jgi:hypothetical protein